MRWRLESLRERLRAQDAQPAGMALPQHAEKMLQRQFGSLVDLVDLRTVVEPLLGQIVVHGKRFMGDDVAYAELIRRHLFDEADFMPYYRRVSAERRQAWIAK